MKKIYIITAFALILSFSLCGCVYDNTTANINADGSGRVVAEIGFSKVILDKLGRTMNDFTSKQNENHLVKANNKEYIAEIYEDAFLNPEEINWSSGIATVSKELGPVELNPIDGGLRLTIKLWDEIGPDMKAEHLMPELKDVSDETLNGITLRDLVAQDVDGLMLKLTFNMPYNVVQVSGGSNGVVVEGKKITLDYVKMIKSGDHEWAFDSIKIVKPNAFTDVPSDAWYANAINAVADGGIINGYGDGRFYPNEALTYAQLCKIIISGLGDKIDIDPEYWAKNYIERNQYVGYVLSDAPATKENWDVPATREQAVYAITMAFNRQMGFNKINGEDIKDWSKIDPKMKDVILWAYTADIVSGRPDGTFGPKDSITRAELCQMLYNIHWTVPKSDISAEDRNALN